MASPLNKHFTFTLDSDSFRDIDIATQCEIPHGFHVGAFGTKRKYHTHEGIDLYGNPGDEVFAMLPGVVVNIVNFTGASADSPWWNDTQAVLILTDAGVISYGEIAVDPSLTIGANVAEGQRIGQLVRVLKQYKGRPTTMLHVELYTQTTTEPCKEWPVNGPKPHNLLDPTPLVVVMTTYQQWGTT